MVHFDADAQRLRDAGLYRAEIVSSLPVRIGQDVIDHGFAPGLSAVDICGDQCRAVVGDHQRVEPAERAVEKIAVVVDVVIRGEHRGIQARRRHVRAQCCDARGVFLRRKAVLDLFAVAQADQLGHFHGVAGHRALIVWLNRSAKCMDRYPVCDLQIRQKIANLRQSKSARTARRNLGCEIGVRA